MIKPELTIERIREAHERIRSKVHETPVLKSATADFNLGSEVFFKCENFQKIGAFKARGATNALMLADDKQLANGVVTHSSGNHAQAIAFAAKLRGVPAYIVMPKNAPKAKSDATIGYGGNVTFCEAADREKVASNLQEETGALLIHPFNNYDIMAGQGTVALELLKQVNQIDTIVCPIGGGGLMSGVATVIKALSPKTKIIGVEPESANDAQLSLRSGKITPIEDPSGISDGLLSTIGEMTFPIISQLVDEIVTVSDLQIKAAMRFMFERMKMVVEPSGAVTFAALQSSKIEVSGKKVAVIVSGGNTSPEAYL